MTRTEAYREHPVMQAESPRVSNPGNHLAVSVKDTLIPCLGCGIPTKIRVGGRPGHYKCVSQLTPAQEPELETEATPEQVSMFRLLQESITASRKHPVLRIARAERETEPWALITETMRGEHRYRVDAPDGSTVKIWDRKGSYPSAMGNVPVAAAALRRTGRQGYNTGYAGIYLIPRFAWDGPHPLGEIAEQETDGWWVSTPHLRLCMRLAAQGRIPQFEITDSYTAPSVTNLFKAFSAHVSELRETAQTDPEAYAETKRKSSIAIRGLWPKGSRSPFWRPDWSVSVRAEASVRHWVRADQAITAGAQLVRLGNVDEVAFIVPKRARSTWVPEPYVEGKAFGYVECKGTKLAAEWNRPRGRRAAR